MHETGFKDCFKYRLSYEYMHTGEGQYKHSTYYIGNNLYSYKFWYKNKTQDAIPHINIQTFFKYGQLWKISYNNKPVVHL